MVPLVILVTGVLLLAGVVLIIVGLSKWVGRAFPRSDADQGPPFWVAAVVGLTAWVLFGVVVLWMIQHRGS